MANVAPSEADIVARHQMSAPVKVGAIARDLGVAVLISDLPLSISGKLSRTENDGWEVRVNRHEHRNRQRFTIAHEIAHYLLHRETIEGEVVDDTFYRSGLSEKREYEANKLAAEILMPWPLIRQLMSEGTATADGLAQALQVSDAAMHIRLGLPT
jgi:Zn-dependent peptidase ImmA (M78 family)